MMNKVNTFLDTDRLEAWLGKEPGDNVRRRAIGWHKLTYAFQKVLFLDLHAVQVLETEEGNVRFTPMIDSDDLSTDLREKLEYDGHKTLLLDEFEISRANARVLREFLDRLLGDEA